MLLDLIKCTKQNKGKSNFTSGDAHYVTLSYKGKKCSFTFHDNYLNESDKKDFIEALLIDADMYTNAYNLADFMAECGIEDDEKGLKIYNACKKQYFRLIKLFNQEEINQLHDEVFN